MTIMARFVQVRDSPKFDADVINWSMQACNRINTCHTDFRVILQALLPADLAFRSLVAV